MIVSGMIEQEQVKELTDDLADFVKYCDLNIDKKFRREVIHTMVFPIFRRYTWTSRRKNKWTVIYEARSKKEVGDYARITNYATVDIGFGKYAYMPSFVEGKLHFIIYPPHFFSRFNERCGLDRTGQSLYDRFFRDNGSYCFDLKERHIMKDDKEFLCTEVYGSTKDGVAMGVLTNEGNVLFRTFVTYDMLKGDQIETFTKNEQIRREIHDS